MKKLSLLFLFSLSTFSVAADEYTDPVTKVVYSYNPGSGVAKVMDGKDAVGEVTILERFTAGGQEYVVNFIDHGAFEHNERTTAVVFPPTVNEISSNAFYGCSSLTSVFFSEGLEYIGGNAFANCSLTSLEFPEGLNRIYWAAFSNCHRLKSIKIPSTLVTIDRSAFVCCDSLKAITIDENNEQYDSRDGINAIITRGWGTLLIGCGGTVIPSTVKAIGDEAFWCCTSLKGELVIPDSVESIGRQAFYKCTGLTHVTLPKNLRYIDGAAFVHTSLESVTIPSGVTEIGYNAFSYIPTLTSITSLIEEPFDLRENICNGDMYSTVTLYVPAGTKAKYKATEGWKKFKIKELEKSSVGDAISESTTAIPSTFYDLQGRRLSEEPSKGVYIKDGRKYEKRF